MVATMASSCSPLATSAQPSSRLSAKVCGPPAMAVVKPLFPAPIVKRPAAVLCTLFLKRAGEMIPSPSRIISSWWNAISISPWYEPKTVAQLAGSKPASFAAWVTTSMAVRHIGLVPRFMRPPTIDAGGLDTASSCSPAR